MKPLFPYFGGKRRAAPQVWQALGHVSRYVEPFFGSGAVLLANPRPPMSELINDRDHHVANLWRALQADPDEVWRVASAPPSEVELRARHTWLESWEPPDFDDLQACDPYAAGVWLWASSVRFGRFGCNCLERGSHGSGIKAPGFSPSDYRAVVKRIERIKVMCGDWSRCVARSCTAHTSGRVGVFLDPPYGSGDCVYDDGTGDTARDVWQWAIEHGDDPRFRIVVAGYDDRELPRGWSVIERHEHGGMTHATSKDGANANRHRERLWLSPHCVHAKQATLF